MPEMIYRTERIIPAKGSGCLKHCMMAVYPEDGKPEIFKLPSVKNHHNLTKFANYIH